MLFFIWWQNNFIYMFQINAAQELEKLWKILPQRRKEKREKDVLFRRFGIDSDHQSLQTIGNRYHITRERVRQIQNQGIKGLKKAALKNKELFKKMALKVRDNGKIMSLATALRSFLPLKADKRAKRLIPLILVINPYLNYFKETSLNNPYWTYKIKGEIISNKAKRVVKFFQKHKKALSLKKASQELKIDPKQLKEIVLSSKTLGMRENKVGLINFPEISPKTSEAKIDFVFSKYKKPLHFREIAKLITKEKLGRRQPTVPTIHNELIKHRDKYVLIGRGTYALKKWGYIEGTVKDLIEYFIKKAKNKLTKEEIIKKVLKQRLVRHNTVLLNLHPYRSKLKKE